MGQRHEPYDVSLGDKEHNRQNPVARVSEGEVCLDTKNEGAGIPLQEKVSERSFSRMAYEAVWIV